MLCLICYLCSVSGFVRKSILKVVVVVPIFEAKKAPAVFSPLQVFRLLRSRVKQKRRVVSTAFQQLELHEQDLKNCGVRVFVKKIQYNIKRKQNVRHVQSIANIFRVVKAKLAKPSTSCRMQNTIMGICNRFALLYIRPL